MRLTLYDRLKPEHKQSIADRYADLPFCHREIVEALSSLKRGNTTKKTKKTLINNTFKYLLCIDLNSILVISGKEVTEIF